MKQSKIVMTTLKHYLQFTDLNADEYAYLFERAALIKKKFKAYEKHHTLADRTLAMRAGVETIRIMEEDGLLQNAAQVGAHLMAALQRELGSLPGVKEIRGQGLMLGVELNKPCGALVGRAAEAGLLIRVTADSVIRMVPPLILTTAEADEIVALLTPLVKDLLAE